MPDNHITREVDDTVVKIMEDTFRFMGGRGGRWGACVLLRGGVQQHSPQ